MQIRWNRRSAEGGRIYQWGFEGRNWENSPIAALLLMD